MFTVQEVATSKTIAELRGDEARAQSAFIHRAAQTDEPLALVSADGQIVAWSQPSA